MIKDTRNKGGEFHMNTDALELVQRAFVAKYMVKVGIIGNAIHTGKQKPRMMATKKHNVSKTKESRMTNVEIGFIHEHGSKSAHIPRRSFLFMPLLVVKRGLVAREMQALWNHYTSGKMGLKDAYKRLGIFAEKIVQNAFATRGYGHWAELKYREGSPLIDTGQLRKSITSQVVGQ